MSAVEFKTSVPTKCPSGDGLFAKRDIKQGEVISYYNGLIFNVTEQIIFTDNMTTETM